MGASPETVRSVKNEMRAVSASSSASVHDADAAGESLATVRALLTGPRTAPIVDACRDDRAFTDREDGQPFVDWLNTTSVESGDLWRYVDSVPLSRVYVIADGETEVTSAGRHVARLGPGGYVGEIALLRDVPRTATVTATTDVRFLCLERDVFLRAMTGHEPARAAADSSAASRLEELDTRGDPGTDRPAGS